MSYISVTTHLDAQAIAAELIYDGEFTMNVLAELADKFDEPIKEISSSYNGSEYHMKVISFLRKLADELEKNK